MASRDEILNSTVGRRVADLRKRKGLSQSELASRLPRKRTQAWMSNVESGSRSMNSEDLVNVAITLETTVGELFSNVANSPVGGVKPLVEFMSELVTHMPIEMPVYLQQDVGKTNSAPIDYNFASKAPANELFNKVQLRARWKTLSMMVVERYYQRPRLQPSDVIAFNNSMAPVYDSDERISDRVLIKLYEPYDGIYVHPGLIKSSGEVEFEIEGRDPVVFAGSEFELLGVVIWRRTDYAPSARRTWLQRKFGITKDDRSFQNLP